MLQPGRQFTAANSTGYRFGFNGKEKSDEVEGNGVDYDYGARIYDARVGRFLSADPLTQSYPWYTPYQFAGNTPMQAVDLDGLEELKVTEISKPQPNGTPGKASIVIVKEYQVITKGIGAVSNSASINSAILLKKF